MKPKLFFIFLIMILLYSGVVSASKDISLTLLNQDPDPAIAGNIVEFRLALENKGGTAVQNLIVEVSPEYPFKAISGEDLIFEIGTLNPYQTSSDMKVVKFKLRTDQDTYAGTYNLNLNYYENGGNYVVQKTVSIDVTNQESAEVIHINQVELLPGKKTTIQFTINNVGSSPLRDLTFSWNNNDETILPVGGDNTKYIQSLGIKESVLLSYEVMADSSADAGLYKLDLTLIYKDIITNQENVINTIAGIYVGGETDFEVSYSDSSNGEIAFTIANIGSNDATSVMISLPEQQGVSVSGASSSIIGNLNKGDYTVTSFSLQTAKNEIDLEISYTDTTGERISLTKKVSTGLNSKQDTSVTDSSNGNNILASSRETRMAGGPGGMGNVTTGISKLIPIIKWSVIIIFIIVAGFVGFKIYRKKHKNKLKNK